MLYEIERERVERLFSKREMLRIHEQKPQPGIAASEPRGASCRPGPRQLVDTRRNERHISTRAAAIRVTESTSLIREPRTTPEGGYAAHTLPHTSQWAAIMQQPSGRFGQTRAGRQGLRHCAVEGESSPYGHSVCAAQP
jgi:hypothetical protein